MPVQVAIANDVQQFFKEGQIVIWDDDGAVAIQMDELLEIVNHIKNFHSFNCSQKGTYVDLTLSKRNGFVSFYIHRLGLTTQGLAISQVNDFLTEIKQIIEELTVED